MAHFEPVTVVGIAAAFLLVAYGVRVAIRVARSPAGDAPPSADVAGVIAPPPLIYVGFLALGALLEALWPLPFPALSAAARYGLGGACALLGVGLAVTGARRFSAAGTNIPPTLPTTTLVVDGPYRWTRNPLYLAMALIYIGIAIAAGSLWTLGLLVPLLVVINQGVISREEHYLERKFGEPFRAYKARVRRWL
jgi:protein-S-isoprenylcysteine O-methyltransferase Ste14